MKHKFFSLFITVIGWQSLVFSQSNPLLKYVPDDVSMVMHIDAKRLGGKIPKETFRQSVIYREMMKDPKSPLGILNEPEKMGVDISGGVIMAFHYEKPERLEKEERFDRSRPEFHIFIKISDAALFTSRMQEIMKDSEDDKIEVFGTDRLILSGGSMVAGWNNEVFVLSNGYSNELNRAIRDHFSYVDTVPPKKIDMERIKDEIKIAQRKLCFELLTPKPQGTIQSNPYFLEVMHREADIQLWTNGGGNPVMDRMAPFADLLTKLEALGGKNKTAVVNFENGKIVAQSSNFPEGPIAELYKKYPAALQNMDLAKRLPEGVLLGIANISFNQEMSNELLQQSGLMQILDNFKKDIPFDLSLIPGTFKSNIMIAAVKTDTMTTTDESIRKMGGLQLIIALPIADKAKFEQLKPAIKLAWDSLNAHHEGFSLKQTKGLYAKHSDDMLVLALSPQTAEAFLQNPGKGEVPAMLQQYSKYPMVVSVGLGQIMASVFGNNRPEDDRKGGLMSTVMDKFDQVLVYGGNYENGSINSRMEFRFSNKEENALKQLFDLVTSVAENKEAMMRENEGSMMMDTAVMDMDTASINIPEFKDPEVSQFAREYAEFMFELMDAFRSGMNDTAKVRLLGERGEVFGKRSEKLGAKLSNDPDEAKKFTDWMVAITDRVTSTSTVTIEEIKQEESIPPPPPPPPPAKIDPPKIEIPKFTNPEAKAFAVEYAAFVREYIVTFQREDLKKITALDKKGEAFYDRAELIKSKLANDPKESKKFDDWIEKVNSLVGEVVDGKK